MQGIKYGNNYIFLYETMLHTKSPLLKEIYCESHRLEPWAVKGIPRRYGRYVFPNVLYIEAQHRDELLDSIPRFLREETDYADMLLTRFTDSSIKHQKCFVEAVKGHYSYQNIKNLTDETAKILSSGIFKEVFEYDRALEFLSYYMPVQNIKNQVLALYQPLCAPHFLKFEMKMLFFAQCYAKRSDEKWIRRCIDKCAYLSRFLVEDTPFDHPEIMQEELNKIIEKCGGSVLGIKKQRKTAAKRRQQALKDALLAERDILQIMDQSGKYSLQSKIIVKNCLRFIQIIATLEELKHIFAVQTAKAAGIIMKTKGISYEETSLEKLLSLLD